MLSNLIKRNYVNVIFSLCSVVILQLSFNYNFFNAVQGNIYREYENDSSEALVVGKILNSRYDDIFNNVVLGWYGESQNQYNLYLNNINPFTEGIKSSYNSSFGLQGYIYSIIERILDSLNIKSINKLNIMIFLTSFFMVCIITIFANYIRNEFGLFSSLVLIISMIYSQWLVLFAKDIYWIFAFVLLPFIYSWTSLQNNQQANLIPNKIYFVISFFIFIKCLCGFEYISTIFVSIVIPYVYFSIKNSWGMMIFFKKTVILYFYAFIGFISSIIFFILQKAFLIGSFNMAFLDLIYTIRKRTATNAEGLDPIFRESIESSTLDVLIKYWNGKAFDLYSILGKFTYITFGEIIILFIFFTLLFFFLLKLNFLNKFTIKNQIALLIATWFSIFSPLSWYILAKPHSYIHDFFNQVLWHVPFVILVFIFISYFIASIKYKKIGFKFYAIFIVVFIVIYYLYCKKFDYKITLLLRDSIEIYNSKENLNIVINKEKNQLIYLYKDCKKEDLSRMFFLHIYPFDINLLLEDRKKYNFDNLDFNWKTFEIDIPLFSQYSSFCIATKDLPIYSIKNINTGQVNLWGTEIINLEFNDIKIKKFIPYKTVDENWQNGIHKTAAAFFIENNLINKQSFKIGDRLKFNKSGIRIVKDISYNSKFINVVVDGDKLDSINDGYPNIIEVLGDK